MIEIGPSYGIPQKTSDRFTYYITDFWFSTTNILYKPGANTISDNFI